MFKKYRHVKKIIRKIMINFRGVDSSELLFESVYKVEKLMDKVFDVQKLHPLDGQISEDTKKLILKYCFPLGNNMCNYWDDQLSVYIIQEKGQPVKYLYIQIYQSASKIVEICLISKFLHIRLISKIFYFLNESNSVNVLSLFANIPFKQGFYDIVCPPPSTDYACPYVLSPRSEIASLHQNFLKYYPPFYAAWIMAFLLSNQRILVISSHTSRITQTIMSILSFFYPINNVCTVKSLICDSEEKDISNIKGPCIIGLPSIMIPIVHKSILKTDVKLNCDEPNLSCEDPPKFNQTLSQKIESFHSSVCTLTKYMQPGFPSSLILQQFNEFFISFLMDTFGVPSKDSATISASIAKAKSSNANSVEALVSKSMGVQELLEKTDKADPEVMDLLWNKKELNDLQKALALNSGGHNRNQSIPNVQPKRSRTLFK